MILSLSSSLVHVADPARSEVLERKMPLMTTDAHVDRVSFVLQDLSC